MNARIGMANLREYPAPTQLSNCRGMSQFFAGTGCRNHGTPTGYRRSCPIQRRTLHLFNGWKHFHKYAFEILVNNNRLPHFLVKVTI